MTYYLGIDIGTSGTKTLAIREDGTILASATAIAGPITMLLATAALVAAALPVIAVAADGRETISASELTALEAKW